MANLPRSVSSLGRPQGQRGVAATATRVIFILAGLSALVLGYIGLDLYLARTAPDLRSPLNVLYNTLQLFVLGSDPLQNQTGFPAPLQIARFVAPAVTLYALTEAVRLLLSSNLRRFQARRSVGHVVVCGDTSVARTLAEKLHEVGSRVVVVRQQPIGRLELRRRGLLGVNGEASDPDVLRGAGVGRAAVVYACTEDSGVNVRIATTAARLVADARGNAAIYSEIHDPARALALQARRLGVTGSADFRLDFFNLDQLAVQVLLTQQPLAPGPDGAPRLLVIGDSAFARALLVEIARQWLLRRPQENLRAEIDFVAPHAAGIATALRCRQPVLDVSAEVAAHEADVDEFLGAMATTGRRYDRAFLCYADEEQSLQTALATHRLWLVVRGPVVVPVDQLSGLADAFSSDLPRPLLDQLDGRLQLFSKVAAGCDPTLIAQDLPERLARLIHERWVRAARRRKTSPESTRALVSWARLDEEHRKSNRLQAAHIGPKLHLVGCGIMPRSEYDEDFQFTEDEIELLARLESERWSKAATANGWRPGRERDDDRKLSPYLVEWERLPADGQDQCRAAVRDIPEILAEAGFQVVRLAENTSDRAVQRTG
jgi:voltage-gated potassium channel Kch